MTLVNAETGEVVSIDSNGHVHINHIKVVDRHRGDLGDIGSLMDSIRSVGLLHPIVVDGDLRLIAGQRRMEACRRLGWPTVPVRVVRQVKDAVKALEAERDENTCRKAMTPSELKSLTDALLEIERPKASERQGTRNDFVAHGPQSSDSGRSTEIAAKAAGWSRTSYRRTSKLHQAADDDSLPEEVRIRAMELIEEVDNAALSLHAAEEALHDALVDAGLGTTGRGADVPAVVTTDRGDHPLAAVWRLCRAWDDLADTACSQITGAGSPTAPDAGDGSPPPSPAPTRGDNK